MRKTNKIVKGIPASDGAGVKLTRVIGTPYFDMLDPFLLLDAFGSDKPNDYLGGFPDHPHRGFETVTYILNGRMRHKDNAGHEGVIGEGDVQWMSAGRGIVHSEMPEQKDGLLKGFQLWINLPAKQKMTKPRYQEYLSNQLPVEKLENGGQVKVIAGQTNSGTSGPIEAEATKPYYLDVSLSAGQSFNQDIPASHNCVIFVFEGSVENVKDGHVIESDHMAQLSAGASVSLKAASENTRFIFLAGQPLGEPVARAGPFVMNTKAEVLQAFQDFHDGKF
ncbi:MAG: pirin family protein [Alphaproteobacteria bacterium]|nr:pirin family protein [Alphaproteobacteria bacterium]